MTSFLIDYTKKNSEKSLDRALKELRYICCFTCIAKEFEEEKAWLEAERTAVGQRVKVAKRRGDDVQAIAIFWEEEADKIIQEDTKTKQKCFFGLCPNCIWRYRRGKELANKKDQIKKLMKTGKELTIGLPAPLLDVERYSSRHYISFKSRESKCKELLDALKDDNNYIVGLQGMGGTGKTTLAKEVGKKLKQSKQFTYIILTTVSFSPNIKKIQDDIAGPLGLTFDGCSESDRPVKLRKRLTNGEKILLILDDVWENIDFEAIGIPYSDIHKGCRVLATSRCKQVFNTMNCVKRIELGLLSEEDAWIMFQKYAHTSNACPKKVIDIGREIVKECKQLPAAIAIIGSSLRGQDQRVHEWDMKLKSLKKHVSYHGVDDDMVELYVWLKFSYDYMKDEKAKGLFLLCFVFGEDEEIPIEVLTRIFIGAGYFEEDYNTYKGARDHAVVAKNKLLDYYLLFGVGEKHVKMHGLVRDMAQWIKGKEIQKSLVERKVNIQYLPGEGKDRNLLSGKFGDSKLEILFVNVDREEERKCTEAQNSFFENMTQLRVLWFLGNDFTRLSLPYSIQSLTNIRSILANSVDLGNISVLGELQSLETLDLVCCTINELPKDIAKLKKFKLLNLENCGIRMDNPFEVIKRCSSLEELYFIDSFNGFCGDITLPQLQRYHICKGGAVMDDSLTKYVVFPTSDDAYWFSKQTLKFCMQTAEVLRLNGIKGRWRNLMPEILPINLGNDDLVELCLSYISQLQYLVDTIGYQMPNVLSNLVVLKLDRMENLEGLFNGALSFDCFKNLKKVSIKDCKHLRSLFKCKLNLSGLKVLELEGCPMLVSLFSQVSTFRSLVLLETLKIAHCERLENIREEESQSKINDRDNSNKWHGSMFPELKVLDIEGCPLLESMFPFLVVQDLPVLQTLKIRRCNGLRYIFGKYQHVEFHSLNQLELCHLPKFIDMFCESKHPISSSVKGSLADVDQPQDNSVALASESNSYRLNIWERAQCLHIQSKILYNIKNIELSQFSKIKSVFILSIVPKLSLESLTIRNCDELEHIIDFGDYDTSSNNWGSIFPNLKELNIEGCPQLKYILGSDTLDQENDIKILLHLPKLEFLSLRNLHSLVATCPKKYHTTFHPSAKLELIECPLATIKSIGNFITHPVSESLDSIIIKEYGDDQRATIPSCSISTKEPLAGKFEGSLNDDAFMEVEATSGYEIIIVSDEFEIMETKKKQPTKRKQEFVANVPGLVMPLAANSKGIKLITSPTHHSEQNISTSVPLFNYEHKSSSHEEYCLGQIGIPAFSISTTELLTIEDVDRGESHETTKPNNQVSLNDDPFMKVSSSTKKKIPKDDDKVRVSKSRPSTSIISPIALEFCSTLSKGDTSQIVEDALKFFPNA
ncbi:probable disease resistance protein At1g61310 [Vicia villosa]|uniref:probable disease resistance protein At1g61310 n=1 Tax=Vicia villosa TaxID=3911 RepID=UPI00273C023E|nr:probable disease resistance protein At1g61310 [Vicia villosa]